MANSQSALKRVRQTKTRTLENQAIKTRVKNTRKAALSAIESGDAAEITKAVNALISAADRGVKRGAFHKNYSSRLKRAFAAKVSGVS